MSTILDGEGWREVEVAVPPCKEKVKYRYRYDFKRPQQIEIESFTKGLGWEKVKSVNTESYFLKEVVPFEMPKLVRLSLTTAREPRRVVRHVWASANRRFAGRVSYAVIDRFGDETGEIIIAMCNDPDVITRAAHLCPHYATMETGRNCARCLELLKKAQ